MKKRQKDILLELYSITNDLGRKYADIMTVKKERIIAYQEANALVSKAILSVLMDVKDNDDRDYDHQTAIEQVKALKKILKTEY
ncbi:hypothetical protein SAMN04489761_3452 [Tenacibaculum sp. MAR_2009_124]|uniref:hypothetical protein n=1 Tax=Tenacibaculum sp. MAR_2009_124 TaxID=1250059 RepID=UPI000899397A|nr:hypothetical protein [Tenacibaculum sp. MAR_2009_124]SEC66876.1 hypothetical protein SAMN04489761_3452 [Tenacibaculum sp. MAR_2009_124]